MDHYIALLTPDKANLTKKIKERELSAVADSRKQKGIQEEGLLKNRLRGSKPSAFTWKTSPLWYSR